MSSRRPSLATVVAFLALVVALGSTSHAAGLLTGKQIKNESITGKDVKRLSGADLDESSLDTVPRAESADTVGDLRPEQLLTSDGCRPGTVRAQVTVQGVGGTIPETYTSSPDHLGSVHNCTGGGVQVRRKHPGWYYVKFQGNPGDVAVVQVRADPEPETGCAIVTKVPVGLDDDSNAFNVFTFKCTELHAMDLNFSLVVT